MHRKKQYKKKRKKNKNEQFTEFGEKKNNLKIMMDLISI
jgi:hypothetical protein